MKSVFEFSSIFPSAVSKVAHSMIAKSEWTKHKTRLNKAYSIMSQMQLAGRLESVLDNEKFYMQQITLHALIE